MEHKKFECKQLDDGYFFCEDTQLSTGEACDVYFGPCGVYVIADGVSTTGEKMYGKLRDLFGTPHVRLFVQDIGLYEPKRQCFQNCFSNDEELLLDINTWLGERRQLYKESVLQQFAERLRLEDARARRYMVLQDGSILLYRHGEFCHASPHNSEQNYRLAVFGGVLGLHRFAQGKWLTGLIYFFTGGIVMVGWLLDVLFLLLGIQRDKNKQLLPPLSHRLRKLAAVPFGFALNLMFCAIYLVLLTAVSSTFQSLVASLVESTDPAVFKGLIDGFNQFLAG